MFKFVVLIKYSTIDSRLNNLIVIYLRETLSKTLDKQYGT